MNEAKRILVGVAAWILVVTGLHAALNINWSILMNDRLPEGQRRFNVAYIPVT